MIIARTGNDRLLISFQLSTRFKGFVWRQKKMLEKPKAEETESTLVAVGKYVITPEVMEVLRTMKKGKSGEIRLADAFEIMLENNRPLYGKELEGEWLDTGDKFNFIKASIKLGLKHPEIGEKLKKFLKTL